MLIKGEALRFVEVKASGDVIRRNQLTRIKFMFIKKNGAGEEIRTLDPHLGK